MDIPTVQTTSHTPRGNTELLSLDEYESLAKYIVNKKYNHLLKHINFEDLYSYVIYLLAMADITYDGEHSIISYRYKYVHWKICRMIERTVHKVKERAVDDRLLSNKIDKHEESFSDTKHKELVEVLEKSGLTEKEYIYILNHYIYGDEVSNIAAENNVTHQTVYKTMINGMQKLRKQSIWKYMYESM